MAADAQHSNRTLPATPRKIERARAEGQVARSRDLGHFLALGAGVALLAAFAPELTRWLTLALADALRFDLAQVASPRAMSERLAALSRTLLSVLLPIGGVAVLLALAAGLLSGGWNFTLKPLAPQFGKLDPLAGLVRLFSGAHVTEAAKACGLSLLLVLAGGWMLNALWPSALGLLAMPLPQALVSAGELLQRGLLAIGALLALFAVIDVPLQRHMLARRLRMSLEEVKREMRESEGNTEVKGRMRARMRELVNRRMLAAVPRADLVVMNPTHYAVALKYDEAKMGAPRVVAKGADLLALRIRDIAKEARVPVLQAPPLARALYAHTEVDHEVPARLFGAVAQVLAWVYQLRDAAAAGRPFGATAPVPEVPEDMDPLAGGAPAADGAGA
ncbi:MAG: EscU/YscU/HrcU family type III secretion system export apparatus switch protein [Burkholderiales bacterium]|nr:EscU/YscU/HrcU family type III secretion system export apparatus switch protein [Burkholderiales bacterium]